MTDNDDLKYSAVVEVIDGGPIKIKGQLCLKDLKKDINETPEEVYLCRCGQSTNKPYCDFSHNK